MSNSLSEQRAMLEQERAQEHRPLWEAILALDEAVRGGMGGGLPGSLQRKAQADLMRAGSLDAGQVSDDDLLAIGQNGNTRLWRADMGQVYAQEIITVETGEMYLCMQSHVAQALYAPGTEGGRTLFRLLREEPETGYLEFAWGEHVPYGAVRRDPVDGKLYTPIHAEGIALYEPHYPHLVPSQYVVYAPTAGGDAETERPPAGGGEKPGGPETPGEPGKHDEPDGPNTPEHPRWADLPDGHLFAPGDMFLDYGKTYRVTREFRKQDGWRPPALVDQFYERIG